MLIARLISSSDPCSLFRAGVLLTHCLSSEESIFGLSNGLMVPVQRDDSLGGIR
jgi:hypothetical protein